MKLVSLSPKATMQAAKTLAQEIMRANSLVVIGLTGDLGAGKTTFVKGLMKGLGIQKKILSPTFLIMKKFQTKNKRSLYHIDAYRVGREDLLKIGFRKILKPSNVIVIEWANKIRSLLPKGTLWIKFEHGKKENERHLTFNRR